jgi:UDPglucose 6-dehydrogenase
MKIGIVGYGFVGKALHGGIHSSLNVLLVDPKLNTTEDDLYSFKPDIIFVCVPTPMGDDGNQDLKILNSVISKLKNKATNCPIVLKSTILPDALTNIEAYIPNIIYNPEFLREKHADYDFINSNLIVIGGEDKDSMDLTENFYRNCTKCKCNDFIRTDLTTASILKFTINSFLATKVSFFNEVNQVFERANAKDSWENFVKYLSKDIRLGGSHMSVPGHDGKLGFGGACLPKDSRAFNKYANLHKLKLNVLSSAISVNNSIRQQYGEDERELDQNISFNTND